MADFYTYGGWFTLICKREACLSRLLLTTFVLQEAGKILTGQRACCYYSSDFLSMHGYILAIIWGPP